MPTVERTLGAPGFEALKECRCHVFHAVEVAAETESPTTIGALSSSASEDLDDPAHAFFAAQRNAASAKTEVEDSNDTYDPEFDEHEPPELFDFLPDPAVHRLDEPEGDAIAALEEGTPCPPVIAAELWEHVEQEIESARSDDALGEWVLAATDIFPISRSAERDLLFDLVAEEIEHPERILVATVAPAPVSSSDRRVENAELAAVFDSVSRTITAADLDPRTAFRSRARAAARRDEVEAAPPTYQPAEGSRRMIAALIDGIVCFALTVGFSMFSFLEPEVKAKLLRFEAPNTLDVLANLGGLLLLFFAVWTFALALLATGRGQTFGQKALGIRVLNHAGTEPTLGESILRMLLVNVSVISLGLSALGIFGRSRLSLQDRLSGTVIALNDGSRSGGE